MKTDKLFYRIFLSQPDLIKDSNEDSNKDSNKVCSGERQIWFYDCFSGGVGCSLSIAYGRLRQRQQLVRSLPITQLELLGDALLDFTKMADLEIWLDSLD
jgi:Domain of unknown function (DUF4351)